MATLCMTLPPFSPDYSGVASACFDLGGLSVLHDASGCTGNYTGYDEPRWYGSSSPVYCSGLREIDAVLGRDDKLVEKVLAAAETVHPPFITIIGSPVPMVVGCDCRGIAAEIEDATGIPSFGFDTTGTRYYDWGLSLALDALAPRFIGEASRTDVPSINILGYDMLDFGMLDPLEALQDLVKEWGFEVGVSVPVGLTMEGLRTLPKAWCNLVVSRSGLSLARYLKRTFGQPYLVGLPYGAEQASALKKQLIALLEGAVEDSTESTASGDERVLVLGEQVASNAIRNHLAPSYGKSSIVVASPFGLDAELSRCGDLAPSDERSIATLLRKDSWQVIVADPLYAGLLDAESSVPFYPVSHYALSSKYGKACLRTLIGERADAFFSDNRYMDMRTPHVSRRGENV